MDLEKKSIHRIQTASEMSLHHYGQPLVCTYSGGKDSDVMLELFKRSGVPFEVHNSHTTADSPDTVRHIREVFRDLELKGIKCTIDYHVQANGKRLTMWNLIPIKLMPPSRLVRYCCSELKETGCSNRMIATGVRWDESQNRKKNRESYEAITANIKNKVKVSDEKMLLSDNDDTRKLFEQCQLKAKTVVNPIIDWKTSDIFEFADSEKICMNCMYKMGYDRVGCIGCPMAGKKRWKEFADYPKYKQMYIHAFDRMLEERKRRGMDARKWQSGEEVFLWWMEEENISGQLSFNFDGTDLDGFNERV